MPAPRNVLLPALLALVAGVGLIGCGSGDSGKADAGGSGRRAGLTDPVELCVGDRAWDRTGATVKFELGKNVNGSGPFPLEGNWCDTSSGDYFFGNVDLTNGSRAFRIKARNALGQAVDVECGTAWIGWKSIGTVGDKATFTCSPWKIEIVRERDGGGLKHYQAWVTRA